MESRSAITALSALAHQTRLAAFRMLAAAPAGGGGIPAGDIARALDVPASTLSTHLAALEGSGLICSERASRHVLYRIEPTGVSALMSFLMADCCGNRPELCLPAQTVEYRPMPEAAVYNVLFLCTGNSARSVLAEAILNRDGAGRFRAYSAGSLPKGQIHPMTLDLLESLGHPTGDLRSKNWDEFAVPGAPAMDFVFTVCDSAASEVCPVWPGQPMTAHWGVPDPAAAEGSEAERRQAFTDAYGRLSNRISLFLSLPMASIDRMSLQRRLEDIGR